MVKNHISEIKYCFLRRYDDFLLVRKNKLNRYYAFFLFFSRDYFVYKLINKLMRNGKRSLAISIFRRSLLFLKFFLGFQPFFFFKHISFRMRQLFKIQKKLIRDIKIIYVPLLLKPHNQVTYGINHLIKCARSICLDENKEISYSLSIVFLNCFIVIIKKRV